jgi:hypothetical protein
LKVNGEVKIVVGDLARIGAKEFKKVEFVKIGTVVKQEQPAERSLYDDR